MRHALRFHQLVPGLLVAACSTNPSAPTAQPARRARVVEIDQWFALVGIAYQVTIHEAPSPVHGAMWVYSGAANRDDLAVGYGCRMKPMRDPAENWGCDVPFVRGQPDWHAVLARLDSLGVMAPPTGSSWRAQRGRGAMLCLDGTPWIMVIRDSSADTLVMECQVCGPKSPERARYEAGVEALLGEIARRGSAR